MKNVLLIFVLSLWIMPAMSQDRPSWVLMPPRPANNTYEYKVEKGIASTEIDARNLAVGRILQSVSFYLGAKVSSAEINEAVQKGETFDVIAEYYDIPINKVCEYTERINNGYIVYVLCQVAKAGNIEPKFDHFTDCYKMEKNPYLKYAFVPGMAQIKKGSTAKGACFITGEIAFIAGIVASECLRSNYTKQISMTQNEKQKRDYLKKADNCAIARNVSIAGAAAVYVWNVIDGIVAKGKKQVFVGDAEMKFSPYADLQSVGLAININL